MRYVLVLLTLCLITACTSSNSGMPQTGVNTGVTSFPAMTTQAETDTGDIPELVSTQIPLIEAQSPPSCPDAPEIRLIIQQRGRVTDFNDDTLNLRNGPGVSFDILIALNPRDEFTVINGPTCANGFSWFRVRYRDIVGWLAEGDSEDYYVEPYLTG